MNEIINKYHIYSTYSSSELLPDDIIPSEDSSVEETSFAVFWLSVSCLDVEEGSSGTVKSPASWAWRKQKNLTRIGKYKS